MCNRQWIEDLYAAGEKVTVLNAGQKAILKQHAPTYLYQYRKIDEYTLENIKNNIVWAGKVTKVNDPYDCLFSTSIFDEVMFKTTCTNNLEEWSSKFEEYAQQCRDLLVISCFSEKNDSLLMWGHYADCHKGICVEYSYDDFSLECMRPLRPVSYGKKINIGKITGDAKEGFYKVLIRKAPEWSYEMEWRIIDMIQADELPAAKINGGLGIHVPKPKRIIFGSKADLSEEKTKKILEYCKVSQIPCTRMELKKDCFELFEISI